LSKKRKQPTIDIMKLWTKHSYKEWNAFLFTCLKKRDIRKLQATLYGLQAGMTDLEKQKLNSEKLTNFFFRLQRSIENTLKQIYREEFQNPLYDPANKELKDLYIDDKRKKDHDFELILKDSRF